jgi:hypothetical protein
MAGLLINNGFEKVWKKRRWPNLSLEELLDSRSPGRDLNPGSPEYESAVTTAPHHSVYIGLHNDVICALRQILFGYQINEDEVDRACARKGQREEMSTKFWSVNLKGKDYMGDLGVDGLNDVRCEDVD